LAKLDEVGVVYVGARVKSGDILVGKVTPKASLFSSILFALASFSMLSRVKTCTSITTPDFDAPIRNEESLTLLAFSPKIARVIDVQVFTRDSIEKDARAKSIDESRLAKIRKDIDDEFGIIDGDIFRRIRLKHFSSGERTISLLGVTLPTKISPPLTRAPT
jgi:DNA-directed RNA polymerase subunit beta